MATTSKTELSMREGAFRGLDAFRRGLSMADGFAQWTAYAERTGLELEAGWCAFVDAYFDAKEHTNA